MRVPKRKSEESRKYDDHDAYLTPEAIEKLKADLRRMERSRPKWVEELTAAREMGDLSENAAYQYAKGKVAGIDRRTHIIKEKLKNAVVIEGGAGADGSVCLGSTVTVEVNGRTREYMITGTQEADPGAGKLSHKSPVGSALMGRKAGETAIVNTGGREIEYRIIGVS
jgi:transcription elongation GreA/GreB family factor